eukprot:g10818.t1
MQREDQVLLGPSHHKRRSQRESVLTFVAGIFLGALLVLFARIPRLDWNVRHVFPSEPALQRTSAANFQLGQTAPRFTHAQYLGFNIYTGVGNEKDGCLDSSESVDSCYLGNPKIMTDIKHRLRLMRTALDNAYESEAWDRNSTTLKVFIAPEFFFRGPMGAYTASMSQITEGHTDVDQPHHTPGILIVQKLTEMVSNEQWADWLFVFGSVVLVAPAAAITDPSVRSVKAGDKDGDELNYLYFNLAPVIGGGPNGHSLVAQKEYISGIDFLEKKLGAAKYTMVDPKAVDHLLQEHDIELLQGDLFEHEGLTVCIEICLDHMMASKKREGVTPGIADLHLITSSGMAIERGPVRTRRGGPTFLSDGLNSGTQMNLNEYGSGTVKSIFNDTFGVGFVMSNEPHTLPVPRNVRRAFKYLTHLPKPYSTMRNKVVVRVPALGPDWKDLIRGYFGSLANVHATYNVFKDLDAVMPPPTVDIYMPVVLPVSDH